MQYLYAGAIIFFCSFMQTVAGFSFSLFAVPLLMFAGFDFPVAVVMSIAGSIIQRSMLVFHCRKSVCWKPMWIMLPFCLIGLALGIWGLKKMSGIEPDKIRQCLGIIIIMTVMIRLFVKIKPRESVHVAWSCSAAFCSGILNGLANVGGPPLVLWLLAHSWPKDRIRAAVPAFSLLMVPLQLVLMWLGFGIVLMKNLVIGLMFFPLIILAVWLGNFCSHRLSVEKLRLIIIMLLFFTGTVYIFYPWLKMLMNAAH